MSEEKEKTISEFISEQLEWITSIREQLSELESDIKYMVGKDYPKLSARHKKMSDSQMKDAYEEMQQASFRIGSCSDSICSFFHTSTKFKYMTN